MLYRPDSFGQTPLHLAALRGNKLPLKRLITAGSDLDARDKQGKRPLELSRDKLKAAHKVPTLESKEVPMLWRERTHPSTMRAI